MITGLIKGDTVWTYENNVNGLEEGANDVALDSEDNIYIAGYRQTSGYQYPDDYLTQKISKKMAG